MCSCKIMLAIYVVGYFITLFCLITYAKVVKDKPDICFMFIALWWPIIAIAALIYLVATTIYSGMCFLADKAIETLQSIAQKIKKD